MSLSNKDIKQKPLRVAIIGGGIGGLTLGVALTNPTPYPYLSANSSGTSERQAVEAEVVDKDTAVNGRPIDSHINAADSSTATIKNLDGAKTLNSSNLTRAIDSNTSLSGKNESNSELLNDAGSLAEQPKLDLDVSIYESASRFTEIGAGVGLWLRTFRYMSSPDFLSAEFKNDLEGIANKKLDDSLKNAFEFRTGCSYTNDDGREGAKAGISFFQMTVPFGVLTLHRADFQSALAARFPASKANFKKRLVKYEYTTPSISEEEITLHFTDGTTATCDILVGADGIHSATRRTMLTEDALTEKQVTTLTTPTWSGTIVYRALLPRALLDAKYPGEDGKGHRAGRGHVVYFGPNKHVLAFPISQSRFVNLVAFVSEPEKEGTPFPGAWVAKSPRDDEGTQLWNERYGNQSVNADDEDVEQIIDDESGDAGEQQVIPDSFQPEMIKSFEGWDDEVTTLLSLAENPSRWAIHTMRPLPSYAAPSGKVAILGDAAHAMTPHQGAGGGQAIEDALVLSVLLKHPQLSRDTLPLALKAYDEIRRPVARGVAEKARLNGMFFQLSKGDEWRGARYRDTEELVNENPTKPMTNVSSEEDFGGYYDLHSSDIGIIREASQYDASDATKEADGSGLNTLSDAIMKVHNWEWEADPFDQRKEAVRVFEESIRS